MSKTLEQTFFGTLNEKPKRLFAGLKANQLGYFGVQQVAAQLGLHPHTIRAGQKELAEISKAPESSPPRIRKIGGGRKKKLTPRRH